MEKFVKLAYEYATERVGVTVQQNSEKDAGLEAIREAQQRKKTLTRVHKKLSKQVEVLTRESLPPHLRAANDPSSKGEDHGRPTFVEAARFIKRLNLSTYKREGIIEPILELYPKPAAREFAKSHGVRVPHIFGSRSEERRVGKEERS